MAGYSGTPLPRKLGVKDTHTVFLDGVPATVDLGDLGGAHVVRRLPRAADLTLTFHDRLAALTARLPTLFERTVTDGMVWVCWPKKASKLPDRPRRERRTRPRPRARLRRRQGRRDRRDLVRAEVRAPALR